MLNLFQHITLHENRFRTKFGMTKELDLFNNLIHQFSSKIRSI